MSKDREFLYTLRLYDGRYIESRGTSWEEAARAAGIEAREVKRSLPVRAFPTEEESAVSRERVKRLLDKLSENA